MSKRSPLFIAGSWLAGLASTGLLLLIGNFVRSALASFKSCAANNSGLALSNCGKQSLNPGDFVLIGLLILSAALTITLCTAAWRLMRRPG